MFPLARRSSTLSACSRRVSVHDRSSTQVTAVFDQGRLNGRKAKFSAGANRSTDGVFRALTESRVRTPWIEALRHKERYQQHEAKVGEGVQRDLSPRTMTQSYHSVVLPLADDPWLLDTYLNTTGHIRLGTLFMDLDALAGVVGYKHTGDSVTTVTAAVDRIVIKRPLTEICNLELSGKVTYASGRSSMEVSLQVAKAPESGQTVKEEDIMMTCQFVMVSLDPATRKPTNIPAIKPENEAEQALYSAGETNNQRRKEGARLSLLKQAPNDEESELIHKIWQKQIEWHDPNDPDRKPDNVHSLESTKIQTTSIMQPQYRNRHHFMIFGGFLLKQTFELAFCCAAAFAHERPTFVALDPSNFMNPVPVGSVLYCTATVVYTDPPLLETDGEQRDHNSSGATRIQVRVDTKVRNVEHGETKPTGQFNYTFTVKKDIKVMPRSYTEFMMYIDGRRRAGRVLQSLKHDNAHSASHERITE